MPESQFLFHFTHNVDLTNSSFVRDDARPRVRMADVNIFERVLKVAVPGMTASACVYADAIRRL